MKPVAGKYVPFWMGCVLAVVAVLLTSWSAYFSAPFDPNTACCDHLFYRSMAYNTFGVSRPDLNVAPPETGLAAVYVEPYYAQWMEPLNGLHRQPPYAYRIL